MKKLAAPLGALLILLFILRDPSGAAATARGLSHGLGALADGLGSFATGLLGGGA